MALRTQQPPTQIGRLVPVAGSHLHVREDGPEDAPPLVLVHGFLGSMHWFDRLTPLLAEDFHVIRTDLLGHGASAKPPHGYSPEDQARMLGELLSQMGVVDATVVGHSLGAEIAIALAEDEGNVGRLVILDEGADPGVASAPAINSLLRIPGIGRTLYRHLPTFALRMGMNSFFAPGYPAEAVFDTPDRPIRDARMTPYECFYETQVEKERFVEERPLDHRLRDLGEPALVVFGEQDQLFRAIAATDTYRTVPGVTVELIQGAGHSPMIEAPAHLARSIREFVAATERQPGRG